MSILQHTIMNDLVFKMLFTKNEELLKQLVSALLNITYESIEQFKITNPEIIPEELESKFCRLDINMIIDGMRVDLEIQVANEGDYPERSLYYWAREYSVSLQTGMPYNELPRTIVISILDFNLFACKDFHSEFCLLEINRHEQLTDKLALHYYELPKRPKEISNEYNLIELWLALFGAKHEDDLRNIEKMEVQLMADVINAYRSITGSDTFKTLEESRKRAEHNEASALLHARNEGRAEGIAEGKAEGKAEEAIGIAKKLLISKIPVEVIASSTNLTIDQILRLQDELDKS